MKYTPISHLRFYSVTNFIGSLFNQTIIENNKFKHKYVLLSGQIKS